MTTRTQVETSFSSTSGVIPTRVAIYYIAVYNDKPYSWQAPIHAMTRRACTAFSSNSIRRVSVDEYENLLEVIADPKHEEHVEIMGGLCGNQPCCHELFEAEGCVRSQPLLGVFHRIGSQLSNSLPDNWPISCCRRTVLRFNAISKDASVPRKPRRPSPFESNLSYRWASPRKLVRLASWQ